MHEPHRGPEHCPCPAPWPDGPVHSPTASKTHTHITGAHTLQRHTHRRDTHIAETHTSQRHTHRRDTHHRDTHITETHTHHRDTHITETQHKMKGTKVLTLGAGVSYMHAIHVYACAVLLLAGWSIYPLVSLIGRLVARSGRKRGNRQTDRQNDKTTTATLAAHAHRGLITPFSRVHTCNSIGRVQK